MKDRHLSVIEKSIQEIENKKCLLRYTFADKELIVKEPINHELLTKLVKEYGTVKDVRREDNMKKYYYFTFGVSHLLKNYCIKIYGTYEETRKLMFDSFGDKWAFQYPEEKWTNEYNYKEIEIDG